MSGSNLCLDLHIQVSQEACKVVCYSRLLKNFPQFIVIHTVKGFDVVIEAEVGIFLEFSCFFYDPRMLPIWSLVPLHFLNPAWTFRISLLPSCWGFSFALGCEVFFFRDPTFSCLQLFSSELQFWSSRRRRWVYVLLLHHLFIFDENVQPCKCTKIWIAQPNCRNCVLCELYLSKAGFNNSHLPEKNTTDIFSKRNVQDTNIYINKNK